jgi:hypothetical protein
MRAVFDWLGIAQRAGDDLPAPRHIKGQPFKPHLGWVLTEFYDQDGHFLAMTHHFVGRTDPDPKQLQIGLVRWLNFQQGEGHRCNICVLAADRPQV